MGFFDAFIDAATCAVLATSAIVHGKAGTTCDGVPAALTSSGIVTGFTENGTGNHVFLGIPFADSTAGGNRWKPPVSPAKTWGISTIPMAGYKQFAKHSRKSLKCA